MDTYVKMYSLLILPYFINFQNNARILGISLFHSWIRAQQDSTTTPKNTVNKEIHKYKISNYLNTDNEAPTLATLRCENVHLFTIPCMMFGDLYLGCVL